MVGVVRDKEPLVYCLRKDPPKSTGSKNQSRLGNPDRLTNKGLLVLEGALGVDSHVHPYLLYHHPYLLYRYLRCLGLGVGDGHSSTPPLASSAPSAKWGLSLLSNMERAEPIAMCMSRYL